MPGGASYLISVSSTVVFMIAATTRGLAGEHGDRPVNAGMTGPVFGGG